METNACATPPILDAEFTMLSRLATTLRNYRRVIVSLHQRLFLKNPGSAQPAGPQPGLVPNGKRTGDRPLAPRGEQVSPDHAEFIRTQSQLMETMLKAMILASGWKVDGRPDGPV